MQKFPLGGTKEEIIDYLYMNLEERSDAFSDFSKNKSKHEKLLKKVAKTLSLYKINSYNDLNSYKSRYNTLHSRAEDAIDRADKMSKVRDGVNGGLNLGSLRSKSQDRSSTREQGRKDYEVAIENYAYLENYKMLGDLILEKLPEAKDLVINLADKNNRSFDCYLIDDSNPIEYVVLTLDKKKIFNIKKENLSANCLKELGKLSCNNTNFKEITLFDFYTKLPENENPERQYKLGNLYLNGDGVEKNLNLAKDCYTKSAKAGSVNAKQGLKIIAIFENGEKASDEDLVLLANAYFDGKCVEKNQAKAFKIYKELAEKGNADAQRGLGMCYLKYRDIFDAKEAEKYFRKSAEQGNCEAQFYLGHVYQVEYVGGVRKDYTEAIKWYRKAAEQGNTYAQDALATCYTYGWGVPKDNTEAVKWSIKANEQKDAFHQCLLAGCFEKGLGTYPQDYREAAKWYRKSAEQGGYPIAFVNLARFYENGTGVPRDYAEAIKWCRKAAEQGIATGQSMLGCYFYYGKVAPQDYAEAIKWFRKAAKQQESLAELYLGLIYYNGTGVPRDYAEAVKWCKKSLEHKEDKTGVGQYMLGLCFYYGRGVTQDYAEATKWLNKAVAQGNEDAIEFLDTH